MSKILDEYAHIINDPYSIKALATVDRYGNPNLVYKGSIRLNEDGNIEWDEYLESSQTNKNLVASIWFDQTISINILSDKKKSIQIKGRVEKGLTSGKYFEERYKKTRSLGDYDLATVWVIKPYEVIDETLNKRVAEDEEKYPLLKHLDRLV